MSDLDQKLNAILDAADEAYRSPTAIALLEEGVRLADAHQHLDWGMRLRDELVDAAYFGGAPDHAITAFSWMIAKVDEDPERWELWDILWKYKWITEHFPFMHQIDRPTIERTLDDMEQRYERAGYDRRPVTNLRAWNAMWRGDHHEMVPYVQEWWERPRDGMADCWACEVNYRVQYLVEQGRNVAALDAARELLERKLGCAEIPHVTFGYILWPLLEVDRRDQAIEIHHAGVELARQSQDFVMEIGEHIAFAAHIGETDRALSLLERHLPWAMGNAAWLKDGHLIAAGEGLCEKLAAADHDELAIRLPRQMAAELGDEAQSTEAIRSWLGRRRTEIAAAFDARNETDFVSRRLDLTRDRAATV